LLFWLHFFTIKERRVIFILIASTKDKQLVYLTQQFTKEELATLKNSTPFFCPGCGASVTLKIGEIKIPHFAHKSLHDCDSSGEPESPLHLQGKQQLYKFFSSQNLTVELEKYVPAIRQRADLLLNHQIAIEFQCSPISASQIASRSAGYSEIDWLNP
jgi:competence protein CoiA